MIELFEYNFVYTLLEIFGNYECGQLFSLLLLIINDHLQIFITAEPVTKNIVYAEVIIDQIFHLIWIFSECNISAKHGYQDIIELK